MNPTDPNNQNPVSVDPTAQQMPVTDPTMAAPVMPAAPMAPVAPMDPMAQAPVQPMVDPMATTPVEPIAPADSMAMPEPVMPVADPTMAAPVAPMTDPMAVQTPPVAPMGATLGEPAVSTETPSGDMGGGTMPPTVPPAV